MGDLNPSEPTGKTPTDDNDKPKASPPWGDDFDPDRAWSTITKQRDEVKELRGSLADLKRKLDDADEERRKAEEAKLAEDKKFEELAANRQREIDTLKPKADASERYLKALNTYLETERTGLPEHIVELLATMEPDRQLEYLAKHREALKSDPEGSSGIPRTPKGKDLEDTKDLANDYIARTYSTRKVEA